VKEKSGSYFIKSLNKKFFIKSIEKSEKSVLISMIYDYYNHLQKYGNKSLLMKIIGFYRIKGDTKNQSLIMFNNILDIRTDLDLVKYDLKGSTKDREVDENSSVLLDLNFINLDRMLYVGKFKEEIKEQLERDTELLRRYNIMDYSLLVGIISGEEDESQHPDGRGAISYDSNYARNVCQVSTPINKPNEIYFIGIIDNLTVYNLNKMIAHTLKRVSHTTEALSTVPSDIYTDRFNNFVNSIMDNEE